MIWKITHIKGLVAGLGDVYSTYYSESDFKELEESTSGVYYGVGNLHDTGYQDRYYHSS